MVFFGLALQKGDYNIYSMCWYFYYLIIVFEESLFMCKTFSFQLSNQP
jgi:hypothetical protein